MTFEVLENCSAEVVIGDSILYEYNVFEEEAYSMVDCASENDMYSLAPFDLVKNWQRKLGTVKDRIIKSGNSNISPHLPISLSATDMNKENQKRTDTIPTLSKLNDKRPGIINTRSVIQLRTRRT